MNNNNITQPKFKGESSKQEERSQNMNKAHYESSLSSNTSDTENSSESYIHDKKIKLKSENTKNEKSPNKMTKISRSRSRSKEKTQRRRSRSKSGGDEGSRSVNKYIRDRSGDSSGDATTNTNTNVNTNNNPTAPGRDHNGKFDKPKSTVFIPGLDGSMWSFRQFMEAQPNRIESSKAEKIYNKYKKEYEEKQCQIFFAEHKSDEWFKEKYDPLLSERFKEERRIESELNASKFLENFIKGKYERRPIKLSGKKMDNEDIRFDIELSKQLIEALDSEKKIASGGSSSVGLFQSLDQCDTTKQLDLQLLYLRKVHSYCFYCATEYHNERMLAVKCGPIHLRGGNSTKKTDKEGESGDLLDWHKKIYEVIKNRIEESKKNHQFTLEEIEKGIESHIDTKIKRKCEKLVEKSGNWPCKYCRKAFKDDYYVIRHIKAKHQDKYIKIKNKILEPKIYENYVQDKNKITPNMQFNSQSRNQNKQGNSNNQQNKRLKQFGNNQSGDNNDTNIQRGGNGGFKYTSKSHHEYKDLDDPRILMQSKNSRKIVDYSDL